MRVANVMKKLGWHRNENNNVVIQGRQVKGFFRETEREPTEPPKPMPENRALPRPPGEKDDAAETGGTGQKDYLDHQTTYSR